jgi:hypothetical protein
LWRQAQRGAMEEHVTELASARAGRTILAARGRVSAANSAVQLDGDVQPLSHEYWRARRRT